MLSVCLKVSDTLASGTPQATPDLATIDSYIEAQMNAARIPGLALAIVQGNEIRYLKGYGMADSSGRAVTSQTPFMIASTIKIFTALSIMQLVEAGQVELDAPVRRYLPWFRIMDEEASEILTVRHLLNHTSGLSAITGNELPLSADISDMSLETRVHRLSTAQLNRPVGGSFEYSSANYDTLGLIVQTVSGQSYETYVQEHIFTLLDMRQTFTSLAEADQHGLATGYRSWFGLPVPFDAPRPRAYIPSGWAASSSAEDLAHFAIAALNGGRYENASILSSEGLAAMQQPAVQSYSAPQFYGFGWNIAEVSGVPTVGVGGDAPNFQSRILLVPEQHLGIVILMNMDSVNVNAGWLDLHKGVLSLLLNQPAPVVDMPQYMPVFITLLAILIVTVLFGIGMIRSIITLRRWRVAASQQRGPFRRVLLPLGLEAAWALLLLAGFPKVANQSLSFLMLYIPDLGYSLVVSAILVLCWGMLRTALVFLLLWNAKRVLPATPAVPAEM
jgi:CubicO group peptidase (beta-lactamase class C family)